MKRHFDLESDVSFYHVVIKVPDNTFGNKAYAFNREHKTKLRDIFFWLESIYEVECVNYCIMSTHAHFVIRRNRDSKLSLKQAAYRYKKYKSLKELKDARSCEIRKFKGRLNDLSDFMANLQKRFTSWYNQQFDKRRRGQLFNHCYKAIQLKNTKALIRCMQYVELNPLRAQMVNNSADYEYNSWSEIKRKTARGMSIKRTVINALRAFGIAGKSNKKVFDTYAQELLMISKEGSKEIINTHLKYLLMKQNSIWSSGRSICFLDHEIILEKENSSQIINEDFW
ncbi:hypothetical protein PQO03_00825 [Lentisphaera profundi]|uniref:Transposase IS200-like domain-containing protein n=1 Tax=Lentisphaera profundi TaxID=1658616 RepID=A0ABY7VWR4_9BACT|nr:transposase [Lentisphaera profundi]WDE96508.1 hypothetical protein PQO03_00825 [Lentisphaera profundi]